jgi:hypothetical protein
MMSHNTVATDFVKTIDRGEPMISKQFDVRLRSHAAGLSLILGLMSSAAATAADETGAHALDRPQAGNYRLKVGSADVVALPDQTRAVGFRPFFNDVGRAAVGKIYDRSFSDVNDANRQNRLKAPL